MWIISLNSRFGTNYTHGFIYFKVLRPHSNGLRKKKFKKAKYLGNFAKTKFVDLANLLRVYKTISNIFNTYATYKNLQSRLQERDFYSPLRSMLMLSVNHHKIIYCG